MAQVLALSAVAVVQAIHLRTLGFAIGDDGYRAILQSSGAEALEFVGPGAVAAASGLLAVAVAALAVRLPRAPREALAWGGLYALGAVAVLGGSSEQAGARLLDYRALHAARKYAGVTAVLLPFRSLFDDWR